MDMVSFLLGYKSGSASGGNVETEAPVVGLDMTMGNQTVTPSEGKLLSQVTIEKPADLLPEYILKDKNIGGVIGTLAAGNSGGGEMQSTWKYASGKFTPAETGKVIIGHNLGVKPDFVMVWATKNVSTAYGIVFINGFSQAVFDAAGDTLETSASLYAGSTGGSLTFTGQYPMTTDNPSYVTMGYPHETTEATFSVGSNVDPSVSTAGKMVAGIEYEWIAFGGVFGAEEKKQGKYSLVAAISSVPAKYGNNLAITNDGTRLAVGTGTDGQNPLVYDMSGATPVKMSVPVISGKLHFLDYNADGTKMIGVGNAASSGSSLYVRQFDTKNDAYAHTSTTVSNSSNMTPDAFALSPIGMGYAFAYSGSNYAAKIYTGTKEVAISGIAVETRVKYITYSADGAYVALARYGGNVDIYDAIAGTKIKTITTGLTSAEGVSFSMTRDKIAVAFSTAPWAAVYNVSTGAKLYDFSQYLSTKPFIHFISLTNELAVGRSGSVRIFDLSGEAPVEIAGVPAYGGGNVDWIGSNKSGTRIGIRNRNTPYVEVWKRD